MNDFLKSLKSDLLDKRFLPVLAVLGVALLAALAYAVLGAGRSSTAPAPSAGAASSGVSKATGVVAISQAPANPNQAVAETTSGASKQHSSGKTRDPFTPLPEAKKATTGIAKGSSSPSTSSSGSSKSTPSSGGTTPTTTPTPSKPSAPAKPKVYIHFHVTAQFGEVPAPVAGTPPAPAQLKTFPDMALNEPLPSKENPQLVYLGVVLSTGKQAAFALTGEAILHGSATCKPSPTQCQAIVLGAGQSETLEVLSATGQATTYELKLVSIAKSVSNSASAARAHTARAHAASKAGRELLRRDGMSTLLGLRYSPRQGGLVFVGRPAFAARAHAARRGHRR
jgi:hypothetical protein